MRSCHKSSHGGISGLCQEGEEGREGEEGKGGRGEKGRERIEWK